MCKMVCSSAELTYSIYGNDQAITKHRPFIWQNHTYNACTEWTLIVHQAEFILPLLFSFVFLHLLFFLDVYHAFTPVHQDLCQYHHTATAGHCMQLSWERKACALQKEREIIYVKREMGNINTAKCLLKNGKFSML